MSERGRFQAAAAIFLEAAAVAPAELDGFIGMKCQGDAELGKLVREMLAMDSDSRIFRTLVEQLEPVRQGVRDQIFELKELPATASASRPALEEAPGEWIGKYRLLERLGEGGFGRVWVAEQTRPVRRKVALKVIKAGMDTREVLARFEMERQALAIMDHPSVAKVFDAGATERGRPYFVMEYVAGTSITSHCDAARLPVRARIEMLATVCEAVHHAHQKGIIHRDLKPSNILVAMVDGKPLPKVIDFGIAKAAESLTDAGLRTEAGRMMGTPEYMSPEQAGGKMDIDTRSDVYSLGVVAYELVTGSLPFESRVLRGAGPDGIARIIREVDPPKPSTRLSTIGMGTGTRERVGDDGAGIASTHGTDIRSLQRELRGELDWIVMKCLEKERSRRYESASSLAADLRRYLAGEAVMAAPASRTYRMRTFVRRNKGPVAAAALVGAALIAGLGGTLWQAGVARREAGIADAARIRSAEKERLARTVNAFFSTEILAKADPDRVGSAQPVTLREAVDLASKKLEGLYQDEPLIRAEIHSVLGQSYRGMGHYPEARRHLEMAVGDYREALGPDAAETLAAAHDLATVMRISGSTEEAETLFQQTLDARRRTLGNEHPDTCASMTGLAEIYVTQNRNAKAVPLLEEALAGQRASLGERDLKTLQTMSALVVGYTNLQERRKAIEIGKTALAGLKQTVGSDHPETTALLSIMAGVYRKEGEYDEAFRLESEADEAERRVLGEDHPNRISTYSGLGLTLLEKGDVEGAIRIYDDAVAICKRSSRVDAGTKANAMSKLAGALVSAKRFEQAEGTLLEAYPILLSQYGPQHYRTRRAATALVGLYEAWGKGEKAEEWKGKAEGK